MFEEPPLRSGVEPESQMTNEQMEDRPPPPPPAARCSLRLLGCWRACRPLPCPVCPLPPLAGLPTPGALAPSLSFSEQSPGVVCAAGRAWEGTSSRSHPAQGIHLVDLAITLGTSSSGIRRSA